jgi:hypothetical protein
MHIALISRLTGRLELLTLFLYVAGSLCVSAFAAPTVGVGARSNCPGSYLPAGNGKLCQASPDYKDIVYLGENSKKSCTYPYTRVNAGDSKWCVTYTDP